ncbi:hypothetical protein ALP13_200023 [Pseudomonas syringae pv. maculicola]|uniref:GAF domain-containing protein n=1 Tax=Pseudomonas syringae pv. maculicola TaxID=59511 RepID=A0A3M6BNF2_PSEYM|nr:hypothetical protein ALP13_200023 [Pseudomonas syringae pv. maculicola]
MRFVSIAKFTESDWIACAVHDAVHFGIAPGDAFALEESLCNAMRFDHKALVIPRLSQDPKYRDHPNVSRYGFESYIAIPIFFPTDRYLVVFVLSIHSQRCWMTQM